MLEEIKKELAGKDKAAVMEMAKDADANKLGFMLLAKQEEMAKEVNEFMSGKKVAGARARKASLIIQSLYGLFRKASVVAEKNMGKKAVAK